jgi:HSP20 family molecular chaperone IbpA
LRDFVRSQQELSAHAREVTNAEVEKTKAEGNKRLIGEKSRQFERVESLTSDNRETMDELRSRSKALYDETRADAQRRLSQLKTKNETEVKTERERGHDSVNTLRKAYGDAVQHQQRDGERRLTQLDQENRRQLEQDRARAVRVNTTMQAEYSSEAQRVETTGQREIEDRQAKYKHLFTEQQNTNNARLQQNEIELTAKEAKLRDEHFKRMAETQEKADETIIRQKSQFHERYNRADKSHKDSLGHQKEVYLKELYRQKERLDNKMGVEKARESDPFYQMKTFHAKLTENPGSYELTAQVAPHDRHNVDVRVQNDKIVLSAKRAFEDKFANEGVRTTTNAYQTFRQDFKLDVPVDAARVLTKIKEDGSVTVLVPKKGFVKKET